MGRAHKDRDHPTQHRASPSGRARVGPARRRGSIDHVANDRSPSTRDRLLDAALERFSREGWGGTSIRDLARDAGVREGSVYKHFPSKQAIFDALVERADARMAEVAAALGVSVTSPGAALPGYRGIGEEQLAAIAEGFFDAVLHDRELAALRRLFIVSQYRDPQIGRRLRHYWIEQPLAFQAGVFAGLINSGDFRDGLDPMATALAFFGPVLALLQLAESGDGAEERARALLRSHVRHFRTTHLHRTAGAEQEAGKAEQTAGAEQETGEAEQAAETEQEAGKAKQEAGTEQAAPVEPSATAGEEAGP